MTKSKKSGICRDSSGNFIPIPQCTGKGRTSSRGKKSKCKFGVNKKTKKCLKNKRN